MKNMKTFSFIIVILLLSSLLFTFKKSMADVGIDVFQLLNLLLVTISLIGLFIQLSIQNKLARAQLIKDRFDMYWQVYAPVTDDDVKRLQISPTDYISLDLYKSDYEGNQDRIKRLIHMSKLYEYLNFLYVLKSNGVSDPLGDKWAALWAADLVDLPEFIHIDNSYKDYYPDFHKFLRKLWTAPLKLE